jgi:lipoprotein NlpI
LVKGNEFFKKGEYLSAINAYTASLELDPTNAVALANRAMAHLSLCKFGFL